jgi:hypothetical protein
MDEVERAAARPAIGREGEWSENLREQLRRLSSALELHVLTTESSEGLLANIVEAVPRLKHRVDIALDDHVQLGRQLQTALDSLSTERWRVDELREQVTDLLRGLTTHRQLGADLVYEAYSVDIEAGD